MTPNLTGLLAVSRFVLGLRGSNPVLLRSILIAVSMKHLEKELAFGAF